MRQPGLTTFAKGRPVETLLILSLLRSCHFVLIAVGFALVFGTCRVLNLMHGSYVMLGAYGTFAFTLLLRRAGLDSPSAAVAAALLGAMATAMFGWIFFKALQVTKRTRPGQVLAISVAGNLFVASVVAYFFGTEGANVAPILTGTTSVAGVALPKSDLLIPFAAATSVGLLLLWLRRTRSGLALRAVADNHVAAELVGIDSGRLLARAVGGAAFMAGLAGALRAPSQTLAPDMWVHPLLVSFAVVVLGGRNSVAGAIAGACVLGVAETVAAWCWGEATAFLVALVAVALGLALFPRGLTGRTRYENR